MDAPHSMQPSNNKHTEYKLNQPFKDNSLIPRLSEGELGRKREP